MVNSVYYAQDAVQVHAMVTKLLAEISAEPAINWFALIDTAFDLRENREVPVDLVGQACFAGKEFEGLESATPMLFDLNGDSERILRMLIKHCNGRPMISFVGSDLTAPALVEYWHAFHWIYDPDGQRFLLRFADTRTLSVLPSILTSAQWRCLSGPLTSWKFIDREGRFTDASPDINGLLSPRLEFSQAQMSELMSVSEIDAIVELISTDLPDLLENYPRPSELYKAVRQAHIVAETHSLSFSDKFCLVVGALMGEQNFLDSPELKNLLDSKSWIAGRFGDALISRNLM